MCSFDNVISFFLFLLALSWMSLCSNTNHIYRRLALSTPTLSLLCTKMHVKFLTTMKIVKIKAKPIHASGDYSYWFIIIRNRNINWNTNNNEYKHWLRKFNNTSTTKHKTYCYSSTCLQFKDKYQLSRSGCFQFLCNTFNFSRLASLVILFNSINTSP